MSKCKMPEILRNEVYLDVRRNDKGWGVASRRIRSDFLPRRRGGEAAGQHSRWVFFIGPISASGDGGEDADHISSLQHLIILSMNAVDQDNLGNLIGDLKFG